MKLRALIERNNNFRSKSVKLTFAVGVKAFVSESIITRNIGPRPWSEISFYENGKAIRIFVK